MEIKKLFINLLFGLLMVLLLGWVVRLVFDPSPWYGNDILEEKMKDFAPDIHRYNTVFIGSSIVLRNIDPLLFDSMIPSEDGISSYNLGSGGTTPPETYYFYEKLVQRHGNSIRYAFIELRDIGLFHPHNLHTLRKRYWVTPEEFWFISRQNVYSTIPDSLKRDVFCYYGISMLERLFDVNYFNDIYALSQIDAESKEFKLQTLRNANMRGYLPLTGKSARREQFMMDTTVLTLMAETYRTLKPMAWSMDPNSVHLKRIQEIIKISEENGIHCFFLFHPKNNIVQLKETMALLKGIPEKNLINLADPDGTPELYLAKNSFSDNHFNIEGTEVLTRLLAQSMLQKLPLMDVNKKIGIFQLNSSPKRQAEEDEKRMANVIKVRAKTKMTDGL